MRYCRMIWNDDLREFVTTWAQSFKVIPCLEKLKCVMKNLKSGQLDFIPVISHMWIGAWTVLIGCINFIGYLMLIDVKGLERKHFWPLLSCCPYSCLEELMKIMNTIVRLAVFQQKFRLGFFPFTSQNVMTEPTCPPPLSDGFHTTGLFSLLL